MLTLTGQVALAAVAALKEETGATNLCFCGGVGLNSVLNGKLTRELGFEQVNPAPCPKPETRNLKRFAE